MLCPSPWRVPTLQDFETLVDNTTYTVLITAWGYGGNANGSSMDGVGSYSYFWPSTEYSSSGTYYLRYSSGSLLVGNNANKSYGFQVRCVK